VTHVTPFILQAGRSVQGSSLGYHAYSLRVDNLSNQWLQEESTLTWIPPYSLGVVLRLWGTSVALLIAAAPVGQPQLQPIAGEYAVAVFSDEFRTENPGVPVRQFTLVQSVSDLTEGPQPALPPVSVDRLYADPQGNIHHIHSDGTDLILYDIKQPLSGALSGFLPNPQLAVGSVGSSQILDGSIATADIGAQQITQPLIAAGAVAASNIAPGAAASNVGALGGALGGALPNPSIVNNFTSLGSAVALTATVFQTAVALTLGAGTWLVLCGIQFITGGAGGIFEARLTDGATVWASGGTSVPAANAHVHIALPPTVVSPGSTSVYNLQGYSSTAGASIYHISPATGQARATAMAAIKLA
jgi:hypothetical protein